MLLFKCLGSVRFFLFNFFMFLKSLSCSPRLHLFDQKYKNNNIVKFYYISILLLYYNIITVYILKCDFLWWQSSQYAVFSVTWSFRNHSNMLICCSRNHFYYQCGNHDTFLFRILWESSKEQNLFENCNIINDFTVIFFWMIQIQ